jgi:cytochrome c peroxidase
MQPLKHGSRHHRWPWLVVLVAVILTRNFMAQQSPAAERAEGNDASLLKEAQDVFKPLPKNMATSEYPVTSGRVSLGRMLFFDPRISVDGTVGCARCHQSALYATDGLAKSHGAQDKIAPRNAPTVLNSALQFKQHWRGEFENVEEQAKHALLGPAFGNPDYATAMARVKAIPGYTELFKKAFPTEKDPVTEDNWGKAIGAYERTLVTPSRFDEYLGGKSEALTPAERQGLRTFIDAGCARCHNGVGIGGEKFRKFGVVEDYWKATHGKEIDKGRIDLTKDPDDMYVFKVPGLRGVEMTPPYFHDGSVSTLPEAVQIMARVQLGKTLSDHDAESIVTFLKSLTGKLPESFSVAPILPPAGFPASPSVPRDGNLPLAPSTTILGNSKLVFPIIRDAGGVLPLPRAVEQPRKGAKVVLDVSANANSADVNAGLDRAARLLNLYGAAGLKAGDVKLVVVLHGGATKSVLKDSVYKARIGANTNPNLPLIRALRDVGVEVFICGQALHAAGFEAADVAEGISIADAFLTVVVNRQMDGYAYVPGQ